MPGLLHDAMVAVFRDEPQLAVELLRALAPPLAAVERLQVLESTLTQLELHADLALLLEVQGERLAVAVEVQLDRDPEKRYSWPLYASALRSRHRCPACVLVVAPDAATAAWARQPIEGGPGLFMQPLVAGPESLPRVTAPEEARARPELALLSVLASAGDERALDVARAALQALPAVAAHRQLLYFSLVRDTVSAAVWRVLEAEMRIDLEEMAARFRAEDAEYMKELGRAEGRALFILDLLADRGFPLSEAQRERILSCRDAETLTRWRRRALSAPSVDELFADEATPTGR